MTSSPAQPPEGAERPGAASRREEILAAAARLFAARGYHGVGVDEIGGAVGITGPGLYRHFRGKKAMLAELLVGISERLLDEGTKKVAQAADPASALDALIRWHVAFALDSPDLITLHGRELAHLSDADRKRVRRLQRQYVELWVDVVAKTYPERIAAASAGSAASGGSAGSAGSAAAAGRVGGGPDGGATEPEEDLARAAVHAVFGLINSTPYSVHPAPDRAGMDDLLQRLAHGALASI
ncbi:hypothetical protein BIV57_18070 [Mangrovactinospora gilvigrisea]|uniref:HTH tetR-type domain-containing protein n=1 Tax=Mangrovactinospora gilvigrisea TaxID=1428644 RepID=A0A1J7C3F2_9ACTN|nr:TetR family transcriptional regulator [Mangrovactinospora gilvigrisea]OIV36072.1 hypothetical protein BIV57_18070 [Mangrovactinospora gilvigrisea]